MDTLTELLNRRDQSQQFLSMINLPIELGLLSGKCVHIFLELNSSATIFSQRDDLGQVSLRQAVQLLLQTKAGLLESGPASL
jgi:hypothetical protein